LIGSEKLVDRSWDLSTFVIEEMGTSSVLLESLDDKLGSTFLDGIGKSNFRLKSEIG
jgi:hypothetical protein